MVGVDVAERIRNMRVTLYGTQGSCSIFPSAAERQARKDLSDAHLIEVVLHDALRRRERVDSIEKILGGPVTRKRLLAYRDRFDLPSPRVYDGWTTCVRVETPDGHNLIFDAGSGFRNCAKDLQVKWADQPERTLHLFGSHSHNDHTVGFDQAAVCFDPRNRLKVYGNPQFLRALDSYLGIFSRKLDSELHGVQTPIYYNVMPATFEAVALTGPDQSSAKYDLRAIDHALPKPIMIGDTQVMAFEVYHPAPCLAYRVDHGTSSFVFCTDHELRHGSDESDPRQQASVAAEESLMDHCDGIDLLYRDGQYLRSDYDGISAIGSSSTVSRLDWGHSCIEDIQEMAQRCGVERTLIGHHDPNREWSERNAIDDGLARWCRNRAEKVELARADMVIDL